MNDYKQQISFIISDSYGEVINHTRVGNDGYYQTWPEQLDEFVNFLYGQGFIISELQLAEYLIEKAKEVKDLRGNSGDLEDWEDATEYDEDGWEIEE